MPDLTALSTSGNQREIPLNPPDIKGDASHLLLVEDDLTNQLVTWSILTKSGYQVDVANNGSEALKLLAEKDYALVLMDCMMPVMNGYDAVAIIRDQTSPVRNHTVPVIALTAKSMQEDRDLCLAAGMDDYLSKPLDISDMLEMLEKWTVENGDKEPATNKHKSEAPFKIFDKDEFVKRNMDDLQLSCDVATLFVDSAPEYISSIRNALSGRDAVALRKAAHKLKGAAANLALPILSAISFKIESEAEAGDLEKAGLLLPELVKNFELALEALRELLITTQDK